MNPELKHRLKPLIKPGGALLLALLAAAGFQLLDGTPAGHAVAAGDNGHLYAGVPLADADVQILENPGFVVGYSDARRQPLWVGYVATPVRQRGGPKRPRFEADSRTRDAVQYSDYSGTGYTRGHLAPNYAISRLYGRDAQTAAFLMSNISPQTADFNAGTWQRLEELEIDEWAQRFDRLYVMTGPVFGTRPKRIRGGVPVPDAFFRVLVDLERDTPRAIAFIIPQSAGRTAPLDQFVVPIDVVEARTGLDLFATLPDAQEAIFEAARADGRWEIETVGRRPPRYR